MRSVLRRQDNACPICGSPFFKMTVGGPNENPDAAKMFECGSKWWCDPDSFVAASPCLLRRIAQLEQLVSDAAKIIDETNPELAKQLTWIYGSDECEVELIKPDHKTWNTRFLVGLRNGVAGGLYDTVAEACRYSNTFGYDGIVEVSFTYTQFEGMEGNGLRMTWHNPKE